MSNRRERERFKVADYKPEDPLPQSNYNKRIEQIQNLTDADKKHRTKLVNNRVDLFREWDLMVPNWTLLPLAIYIFNSGQGPQVFLDIQDEKHEQRRLDKYKQALKAGWQGDFQESELVDSKGKMIKPSQRATEVIDEVLSHGKAASLGRPSDSERIEAMAEKCEALLADVKALREEMEADDGDEEEDDEEEDEEPEEDDYSITNPSHIGQTGTRVASNSKKRGHLAGGPSGLKVYKKRKLGQKKFVSRYAKDIKKLEKTWFYGNVLHKSNELATLYQMRNAEERDYYEDLAEAETRRQDQAMGNVPDAGARVSESNITV